MVACANVSRAIAVGGHFVRDGRFVVLGCCDEGVCEAVAGSWRGDGASVFSAPLDLWSSASVRRFAQSTLYLADVVDTLIIDAHLGHATAEAGPDYPLGGALTLAEALLPSISGSGNGRIIFVEEARTDLARDIDPWLKEQRDSLNTSTFQLSYWRDFATGDSAEGAQ